MSSGRTLANCKAVARLMGRGLLEGAVVCNAGVWAVCADDSWSRAQIVQPRSASIAQLCCRGRNITLLSWQAARHALLQPSAEYLVPLSLSALNHAQSAHPCRNGT